MTSPKEREGGLCWFSAEIDTESGLSKEREREREKGIGSEKRSVYWLANNGLWHWYPPEPVLIARDGSMRNSDDKK